MWAPSVSGRWQVRLDTGEGQAGPSTGGASVKEQRLVARERLRALTVHPLWKEVKDSYKTKLATEYQAGAFTDIDAFLGTRLQQEGVWKTRRQQVQREEPEQEQEGEQLLQDNQGQGQEQPGNLQQGQE